MEFKPENQEIIPVIETVRAAVFYRGKFLVLRKDKSSRNAGALEFPGGKIDEIVGKTSTVEEQQQATIAEVQEETGIDIAKLPMEKIENFALYYEAVEHDGTKKKYKRLVHLFLIRLPDDENVVLKINETKDPEGQPEDKHEDCTWVSPSELVDSGTLLSENPYTQKKIYPLTQNSRHIKKLLAAVEYLKSS